MDGVQQVVEEDEDEPVVETPACAGTEWTDEMVEEYVDSVQSDDDRAPAHTRVGIAVVGYPGAGKSEAGRILADLTGGILIETGDIVREGAEEHFGKPAEDLPSGVLGDYSTMRREQDGGDYVAQDVLEQLSAYEDFPERPAIISGMRDTESPALFREHLDRFGIVWVHAEFDVRLQRLQDRGRQDEGGYSREELAERDGRESMWGVSDLSFIADARVSNESSLEELRQHLLEVTLKLGVAQ